MCVRENSTWGKRFFLDSRVAILSPDAARGSDEALAFLRARINARNFVRECPYRLTDIKYRLLQGATAAAEAWEPSVTDGLDRFRSHSNLSLVFSAYFLPDDSRDIVSLIQHNI